LNQRIPYNKTSEERFYVAKGRIPGFSKEFDRKKGNLQTFSSFYVKIKRNLNKLREKKGDFSLKLMKNSF
jgi:hypothetical protein